MKIEPAWGCGCTLARAAAASVVFDVGAHTGGAAQVFLRELPQARVFAFEPHARSYAELCTRFAAEPRVVPIAAALGESDGRTIFHEGASPPTSSRWPRNVSGRRYFRSDFVMNTTTEVDMRSLDSFCVQEGITDIDLLKLDTQGGELEVLRGGMQMLSNGRIGVIVTEFFAVPHYEGAPLLDEIWHMLREFGYGLFDLFCGPHADNGQLRYGDAVFVSSGYRQRHLETAPPEI